MPPRCTTAIFYATWTTATVNVVILSIDNVLTLSPAHARATATGKGGASGKGRATARAGDRADVLHSGNVKAP